MINQLITWLNISINTKTYRQYKTYKIALQNIHGLEPSSKISKNMKDCHLILAQLKCQWLIQRQEYRPVLST